MVLLAIVAAAAALLRVIFSIRDYCWATPASKELPIATTVRRS